MAEYYLKVEGVNLSSFVFDTQDLSTVRGGSLMLLDSIEYIGQQNFSLKLEPVSSGASSGLFRFNAPDDDAAGQLQDEIKDSLKHSLSDSTGRKYGLKHATFVVDIQRAGKGFQQDDEALSAKNRWQQMQQPSLAIPSHNSSSDSFCEIDLVRPGTEPIRTPEGEKKISKSVLARRDYGITQKYNFYHKQTGLGKDRIGSKFTQDFDELTSDKKRGVLHHKMAVIYIDGNSFGSLRREKCVTAGEMTNFDTLVKSQRKAMLGKLLEDLIIKDAEGWLSEEKNFRIETLLWGGDEIMWVVPAWQGWKTLSFFYKCTDAWPAFKEKKLKHAASIVFCHHNAPINRIKQLAHDLAARAKSKDRSRNLFTYQVLESFDHIGRSLDKVRKERCPDGCAPEQFILSGEDMEIIDKLMSALKADEALPRSPVYAIVNNLLNNKLQTESSIKALRAKLDAGTVDNLDKLAGYFNSPRMMWIHMQDLWDYVGS